MKLNIKDTLLKKIIADVDALCMMHNERDDLVHEHRREEGRDECLLNPLDILNDEDWYEMQHPEKHKQLEEKEHEVQYELSNLAPEQLAEVAALMDIGREKIFTGRDCASAFAEVRDYFLDGMNRPQVAEYLIAKAPLDKYLHSGVAVLGIA